MVSMYVWAPSKDLMTNEHKMGCTGRGWKEEGPHSLRRRAWLRNLKEDTALLWGMEGVRPAHGHPLSGGAGLSAPFLPPSLRPSALPAALPGSRRLCNPAPRSLAPGPLTAVQDSPLTRPATDPCPLARGWTLLYGPRRISDPVTTEI